MDESNRYWNLTSISFILILVGESPRGVMAKVLNSGLDISKFELFSCFRTNTFEKGMNLLFPHTGMG